MDIVKELQDLAIKTARSSKNLEGDKLEKLILRALTEAYDMGYYDNYVDIETTWQDFNKIISGDK